MWRLVDREAGKKLSRRLGFFGASFQLEGVVRVFPIRFICKNVWTFINKLREFLIIFPQISSTK
jgi:hypothetical protein